MSVEVEDVVEVEEIEKDQDLIQLVTFSIGEEEFGVNILQVQEIIRTMDITKVPRAPEFVEGVINLRGKVIPIVDMRSRFGLEAKDHDKYTRIIVIEIEMIIVGFVVDSVSDCEFPPIPCSRRRRWWQAWIPTTSTAWASLMTGCLFCSISILSSTMRRRRR